MRLISVAVFTLLLLTACGASSETQPQNTQTETSQPAANSAEANGEEHSYTTLTADTFDAFIAEGRVVVDFWAPWCGPCRQLAPIFEELSNEITTVRFGKLNTDDHGSIPGRYGIRGIPTLIVFENGREVDRVVGLASKAKLRAAITGE